jgi:hypothetical protein
MALTATIYDAGIRIRNVAEIRQLTSKFKGDVVPNTAEARSIDAWTTVSAGRVAECIHSVLRR